MQNQVVTSASPEWTHWLERMSSWRPDKAHPALGVAPQKPLLLLVVCDLAEEGRLAGALLRKDGDLTFRFSSYWRIVAPRRRTKPDLTLPFFHLNSEGFWQPVDAAGRPARDRRAAVLPQAEFRSLAR